MTRTRASLFEKVLLASASIPGAFPPVMIDVTVDGTRLSGNARRWRDHGAGLPLSTITFEWLTHPSGNVTLYIIRKCTRSTPTGPSVERRTLSIATRAIGSLTEDPRHWRPVPDLCDCPARRLDYNLTYIPAMFNTPHTEEFDTAYMRSLYAVGEQAAKSGYQWQKYPPGFEVRSKPR